MYYSKLLFSSFCVVVLNGCPVESETRFGDNTTTASSTEFNWNIREKYPRPVEPDNNPVSEAKFQLGRHLFYDTGLSGNGTQSCESCHQQAMAFTDGLQHSFGSTGEEHPRNAQSLVNVSYNATYTWSNNVLVTLEQQIAIPLFGELPVEQGITSSNQDEILQRIRDEPVYSQLFIDAFGNDEEAIEFNNIIKALATFVRGINSQNSAFDQKLAGDSTAMTDAQIRGENLFFGEKLECFHCHADFMLTDSVKHEAMALVDKPFHNTGLYNIDGNGAYPAPNTGLYDLTANPADMGKFRAPSLRNIGLTAPYNHDGSVATLPEVIRNYAAGGRLIESGPNAGDGTKNPLKDGLVPGFEISEDEIADVVAFLESLTDFEVINNPRFANPWLE